MLFKTKIQFFTYIIYYSKNLILIYLQKVKESILLFNDL